MEPEISVNTKVTVPLGRKRLIHSYSRSGRIGQGRRPGDRDQGHAARASMDWSRPRVWMRPSSPHKICGAPNSVQRQSCAGAFHPPARGYRLFSVAANSQRRVHPAASPCPATWTWLPPIRVRATRSRPPCAGGGFAPAQPKRCFLALIHRPRLASRARAGRVFGSTSGAPSYPIKCLAASYASNRRSHSIRPPFNSARRHTVPTVEGPVTRRHAIEYPADRIVDSDSAKAPIDTALNQSAVTLTLAEVMHRSVKGKSTCLKS